MARFVRNKANKAWIGIAMDAMTRQVMALHAGDRSRRSAKRLWVKIPPPSRRHAIFYTERRKPFYRDRNVSKAYGDGRRHEEDILADHNGRSEGVASMRASDDGRLDPGARSAVWYAWVAWDAPPGRR